MKTKRTSYQTMDKTQHQKKNCKGTLKLHACKKTATVSHNAE